MDDSRSPASPTSAAGSSDKEPRRRRKTTHACLPCQKAHLTCQEQRPCQRCIRKNITDQCRPGTRKTAKYLLADLEAPAVSAPDPAPAPIPSTAAPPVPPLVGQVPTQGYWPVDPPAPGTGEEYLPTGGVGRYWSSMDAAAPNGAPWPAPPAAPPTNGMSDDDMSHLIQAVLTGGEVPFGAMTSALEYNILSFMLGGGSGSAPAGTPTAATGTSTGTGPAPGTASGSGTGANPTTNPFPPADPLPGFNNFPPLPAGAASALHMSDPPGSASSAPASNEAASPAVAGSVSDSAGEGPRRKRRRRTGDEMVGTVGNLPSGPGPAEAGTTAGHAQAHAQAQAHARALDAHWRQRVRAIYQKDIQPFHYTEGYHFLLKYAAENFDQAAVLRIVRALALFRPSLIALQMPMTQEDEVFVERSIQRTVLEFEKLISFSGTPTMVWRRTCEICAVGAEFSKLTQWPRHELVGKHIYELFDAESALDYWEKFALHAFENTHQSIMTVANVRMAPTRNADGTTVEGKMMRCAVCYSIKRDVFDLPCLVVANFLPCLG